MDITTAAAQKIDQTRSAEGKDALLISGDVLRKWYVLHTKSRREKKLAERCRQLSIRHYLPLRKNITGRRGRRQISDVPLFPSYIFSYLDRTERYDLLCSGHIANVLDVVDQEGLLKDLWNIKDACDRGVFLEPSSIIKKGQRVRIMDGPLVGLEGVVKRHSGRYRLILHIECIQQAVACEIDIRMVRGL
jgi:transcription antitermination factor NusG